MRWLPIICALLVASPSWTQADTSFTLLRTYRGSIAHVALDNLDNLYVVSSSGQLKKLNNRGDSVGVFNGVRNYGKLYSVDVSNPLKPLLFYKDFSSVVILDRFLATRATLDLRRFNILQPTAIGLSYDNNIWVFDQFDNKLKKVDEAGNLLLETTDFRQLFSQTISPQKILNDNGLVYLADSAQGIFVFDNYGAFKRKIPSKGWRHVDVWDGKIVHLSKEAVVVYHPNTMLEQAKQLPSSFVPFLHSFTRQNKFVTFSQDSLHVYQFRF